MYTQNGPFSNVNHNITLKCDINVFSDYRKSVESSASVPNGKWKQKLHAPVILFEFIHLVSGKTFWYPKPPIDASGHLLTTPPSCIICPKCHSMEITHQMAKLVSLGIKENNLKNQSPKNLTPEQQKSYIVYIQILVRLENLAKVIATVWFIDNFSCYTEVVLLNWKDKTLDYSGVYWTAVKNANFSKFWRLAPKLSS